MKINETYSRETIKIQMAENVHFQTNVNKICRNDRRSIFSN